MNIGKLDRYVGVYSRSTSQDAFGSINVPGAASLIDNAWVRKVHKKSEMVSEGGSNMINQNSFEFVARYNTTLWKAGYYFLISQDTNKYWIRGVEEIGRKEGLRIFVEMEKSRS